MMPAGQQLNAAERANTQNSGCLIQSLSVFRGAGPEVECASWCLCLLSIVSVHGIGFVVFHKGTIRNNRVLSQ